MEGQDIRGLFEAYSQVYEAPEVLNEEVEQIDEYAGSTSSSTTAADLIRQRQTPKPQMKGLSIGKGGFNIKGKPVNPGMSPIFQRPGSKPVSVTSKPATEKPVSTKPTTAAKPVPTAATKPSVTSTSKPSSTAKTPAEKPTAPATPKKTFNPLMQKTFGYQTGYAPDQVKGDVKKMAQTGSLKNISAGVDIFDLVKGHLLDEGYAETEENALVMMANMSEEWRKSILETHGVEILDEAQEARENPEKHEEEKEKEDEKKYGKVRGEKTPMPPRGDKRREAFEKWYAANVR